MTTTAHVELRCSLPDPTTLQISSPSTITTDARHRIHFRHPSYPDGSNLLLDLFAPDHPEGGIQYDLAITACGIIAGNRWDGWFTETKDGSRLSFLPDDILKERTYYFHLPSPSTALETPAPYIYPIVPTFHHWEFPHYLLPSPWNALDIAAPQHTQTFALSSLYPALVFRDSSCPMSGCKEGTQAAHICPRGEVEWFRRNQMSQYNLNPLMSGNQALDDTSNALLLRADLHSQFDALKFIFVPKASPAMPGAGPGPGPSTPRPQYVTHLLLPSDELGILYHNTLLRPINDVSTSFLFARFAWSIFRFVEPFLCGGVARNLIGTGICAETRGKLFSGAECKQLTKAVRSRSESPSKKHRLQEDNAQEADVCFYGEPEPQTKRRRVDGVPRESFATVSSLDGEEEVTTPQAEELAVDDDSRNFAHLRRKWLEEERTRSDPGGTWAEEEAWAKRIRSDDCTMGPAEAQRLFRYYGADLPDELDDASNGG